jgi:hypothetical protein
MGIFALAGTWLYLRNLRNLSDRNTFQAHYLGFKVIAGFLMGLILTIAGIIMALK